MIKVLYVCLGNICRSPIAEGTMRQLIDLKALTNKIAVDSAGTMDYHIGSQPDQRTRKNAAKNGVILNHSCRQFTIQDFQDFDYIIAMDESNLADIQLLSLRAFGQHQTDETCYLLRKFDTTHITNLNVPDPYYGVESDFENVFKIVKRCNESFLEWLMERHNFV